MTARSAHPTAPHESMRAVRNTAAGIEAVEMAVPTGPGVLVAVTSAGICGSDLHAVTSGEWPVVLGHEFGGRLADGTLVAVQPSVPCRTCAFCLRGDDQLCADLRAAYYGASLNGGLADFVVVDEACLVPVPLGVDPLHVGLVEPIAVAVHAVNRAEVIPGERALVIGGGTIGLLSAAVLADRGAAVDIMVRHDAQRAVAQSIGLGLQASGRYQIVVDAAGSSGSLTQGVRSAERGGRVVLVALPWSSMEVPIALVMKEVRVIPAVYYGFHDGVREFAQAAEFLGRNAQLAELLITHRFGLKDAAEAFRVAADRAAGAIKVQFVPHG